MTKPPAVLRPTGAGRPAARRVFPSTARDVSIGEMRARYTNLGPTQTTTSWSGMVSPSHLDFTASSGVSAKTTIHGAGDVDSSMATWSGAGSITIALTGLKSGSAYILGCTIISWKNMPGGFPVSFSIGNTETTVSTENGAVFTDSVAIIASGSGFMAITITPQLATPWAWKSCTLGTAS